MPKTKSEIDWENINQMIWVNGKGQIVIDSRIKKVDPLLLSCVEDNLYYEDDGEHIDWYSVKGDYEDAKDKG